MQKRWEKAEVIQKYLDSNEAESDILTFLPQFEKWHEEPPVGELARDIEQSRRKPLPSLSDKKHKEQIERMEQQYIGRPECFAMPK
jgi:hypothetical protein